MTRKSRSASRSASRSTFIKKVMENHKKGLSLREAVKKSKSWNKLSVGYKKSPNVTRKRRKRRKRRRKRSGKKSTKKKALKRKSR